MKTWPVGMAMAVCLSVVSACMLNAPTPELVGVIAPVPPVARVTPYDVSVHGEQRTDEYHWLRDDTRSDPEVLNYLRAENDYAEAVLEPARTLQEQLYREIVGLMPQDPLSMPRDYNGFRYRSYFPHGAEYAVHVRQRIGADAKAQGAEQVLLDEMKLASGEDYFSLGNYSVSPNNRYLAYTIDLKARGLHRIHIRDLQADRELDDYLVQAEPDIVWANDNKTLFYIRQNPVTLLGDKVYRHVLGTPQEADVLVYEETDKRLYTWLYKSSDDSLIYIYHQGISLGGASILSADDPQGTFEPFVPLEEGHRYEFFKSGSEFYIRTNWQAPSFRLMKVAADKRLDKSNWEEVMPARADTKLEAILVFNDYLVLQERSGGIMQLRVVDRGDGQQRLLEFEEEAYTLYIGADEETAAITALNNKPASTTLRVLYNSLTRPSVLYEFDLESGDRILLDKVELGAPYDDTAYASERLLVRVRDGVDVPVSLVYRLDSFKRDGSNPVYLLGYGAYGLNQEPEFWSAMVPMLDRGFVYAIAHVRGGGMMGPDWYASGRRLAKKNTFNDFIDVTEELVTRGYGAADKIFASGASAGGTLAAAVATQRPDLYRAVVMGVPFVDVVTTMLDESIPLVTNEYEEWGNPAIPADYRYMLSYSPYDQITFRDYTNMLIYTGLHDSQVQYYEPAKFVARMRARKTDDKQLLFVTEMEAGHGGQSGRYKAQRRNALEFAFLLNLLERTAD